MLVQQYLRV